MLRKREDNIFTHVGRQVHAIVVDQHPVVPCQRQQAGPFLQFQPVFKCFQTAHTLAGECQAQAPLNQDAALVPLRKQIVLQRRAGVNQLVNAKWRRLISSGIRRPTGPDRYRAFASFLFNASLTDGGTKALTSPPNRAISFTMRELRNV